MHRHGRRRCTGHEGLAASLGAVAVATIGYHFVLQGLGGAMTLLDGATTVVSSVATVLMWLNKAGRNVPFKSLLDSAAE